MDHGGSGPCARSLQQDPLVVCGSDIMLMILSRLDARSLASTLGVSRRWRSVASSDIIWSKKLCATFDGLIMKMQMKDY
ncbi:putative F-box domain-containing protein [Helianthus annuus]|uniref:F-box domain-containing protein n=1 Tax=Helianthus annuus TaxID=4232 RepID=A0A9K3P435_HELAN|nr:putative F-box domain-containing protein [Helianthus annuus]KAJ0627838.1 putative F-box domain-containing protein [Helianthus annuus]